MEKIWLKNYDPGVPASAKYPETTLPQILEKNARLYPESIATEFFGAKLTYRELWDHVVRMANGLSRMGVREGTKVAIMLPNSPQCVIAFYASLWLGAIVVLTNPLYVERELTHQWNDSDSEFLIILDHVYPKAEKVLPQTAIRKVIVTSIKEYLPFPLKYLYPLKARHQKLPTKVPYGKDVVNFTETIKSSSSAPIPCGAARDRLALLQYTGGTTGLAKGAMLTHANILANVVQLVSWFPTLNPAKERFLAVLPFFHVFGLTVALNLAVYTGSTLVIMPRFEVNELIKVIEKRKPSVFPGVPAIYTALMAHPKVESFDLSSISFCVTGSAPMPVEILRRFENKTGSTIVEGYGLSEASPVTHANPISGTRKPGSIGLALPDTECKIVDSVDDSHEMPFGEVGELLIRGPQVMQGYWKKEAESADTLRGGWLHTGDLAMMDESGYVFIVDRKKDLVITSGYNVYPREIEEILYEHPKVLDAAAIGVPDEKKGEVIKVFVVARENETLSAEEITDWCRQKLAPYKIPKQVEFRDALPKTMVGKVLRRQLRLGR